MFVFHSPQVFPSSTKFSFPSVPSLQEITHRPPPPPTTPSHFTHISPPHDWTTHPSLPFIKTVLLIDGDGGQMSPVTLTALIPQDHLVIIVYGTKCPYIYGDEFLTPNVL